MRTQFQFGRIAGSVLLGVYLIGSTGCDRKTAQAPSPAPSVTVAPVEQKEMVEWDEFTGGPSRWNRSRSARVFPGTSRKCGFNRANW